MRHSDCLSLALLSGCILAASPLQASPPSPCQSTVPACFIACPAGDLSIAIVVNDFLSNPEAGADVFLDFCGCPDFRLSPLNGTEAYAVGPSGCDIRRHANSFGIAAFAIRGGGTCLAGAIRVFADGIPLGCPLASPPIASPDQNGDLVVDAVDRAIAAAKLGTADQTADFDCDSLVTEADLSTLEAHVGHSFASTVDVATQRSPELELAAGAPNPFARETRLRFALPTEGPVRLTVHDLQGRVITTLVNRVLQPGWHAAAWDGRDAQGSRHRAGLYWLRLSAAGATRSRSIVLTD